MATFKKDTRAVQEGTVCSICVDNYKSPRYLPCKHSFCHDCLSAYISSHFISTESRLGFHCPFCRDYVPNICAADNPEDWTRCFPRNRIPEKYVNSSDQQLCEACQRESEEEKASHFCLNCNEKLCDVCTKCHRKGLTTRKHDIVSLSETLKMSPIPDQNKEVCIQHKDRLIALFCQDHKEPCCTLCVSITHRKCENVESIDDTAIKLRKYFEGKEFNMFLEHVEIFENKLLSSKFQQEMYVRQIEITFDKILDDTVKDFDEAINHLQFLKNQLPTNMTMTVKESKEKYKKNIKMLWDGINCARFIANRMEECKGTENAGELTVAYHKSKNFFERLKQFNFSDLNITIKEEKPKILKEIMKLTNVTPAQILETTSNVKTDIKKIHLCLISEINLDGKYARDGTILSSGEFLLSTRVTGGHSKDSDECYIYNKFGKLTKKITSLSRPFGVIETNKEIIIACSGSKYLKCYDKDNFKRNTNDSFSVEPYCFTSLRNSLYMYVACGDKIIKIFKGFRSIDKTFPIGPVVKHVIGTRSHIVYSNQRTNEVVAMDSHGTTKWRYSSPCLLSPCGLGVDGEDNIYVAGKESDNVHVLTKDGQCVRVFEDITRPDFMKVDKEKKLCFVGSMRKYLRVYEML